MQPPGRKNKPRGHWKRVENRRQYFIDYANAMGFDPFVPSNWDMVRSVDVKKKQVCANNKLPCP